MKVFWDTNLFIYWLEPNGQLTEAVVELERRMRQRKDDLCTSTVTLGELLVYPTQNLDAAEADRLTNLLFQAATIIPFDVEAAKQYAIIRAETGIRGPDALQLACATATGAELFITNDDRLLRRVVPGGLICTSLAQVPI